MFCLHFDFISLDIYLYFYHALLTFVFLHIVTILTLNKLNKLLGWSLNQPNICPARAMYGVDIILNDDNKPLTLEVQWAPDCSQAVIQNKYFWNEILGGLYLNDFTKFHAL